VKRCSRIGPAETPDSNGIVRARIRRCGRVAKTNENHIIDAGMTNAKIA
jgi:hypothetical protein